MKNRDYKKLVTIATAVALIVESLGAVSSPTLAKDAKTTAQTTTAEKKTTKEKEVSSDSKPYKSETTARLASDLDGTNPLFTSIVKISILPFTRSSSVSSAVGMFAAAPLENNALALSCAFVASSSP